MGYYEGKTFSKQITVYVSLKCFPNGMKMSKMEGQNEYEKYLTINIGWKFSQYFW